MGLVLAAFSLRFFHIGQPEIWLDEAHSFYVTTSIAHLGTLLLTENSPPLYFLLLSGWVNLMGTSETALRLPSAVFGALFVATVVWAGWTFFTRAVGLWAGAFVSIAPIHIYYSQEARPYSLLILLILLTYVLLWRALGRGTWTSWALALVSAVLACYTHYFAILGLLPTALLLRFSPSQIHHTDHWRRYGTAVLVCSLLVAPWYVWSQLHSHIWLAGTDWIEGVWTATPPLLAIPKTLEVLGLGAQSGFVPALAKIFRFVDFPSWLRLIGLGVLILLGLWVACPWMDQRLGIQDLAKRKALLWGMLGVPLAALWLISLVKPIYVVGRYDLLAFPAYGLLVGLAFAKLQSVPKAGPVLVLVAAAALGTPLIVKLDRYYEAAQRPYPGVIDAAPTAETLANFVSSGDVVVFTQLRGMPVLYYLHRLGFEWVDGVCHHPQSGKSFGCRMFPLETEAHPGIYDAWMAESPPASARDNILRLTRGLREPDNSLWVVFGSWRWNVEYLVLTKPDANLIGELTAMGFRLMPHEGLLNKGVVRMRR
jgi:uncharacterized membrane protein